MANDCICSFSVGDLYCKLLGISKVEYSFEKDKNYYIHSHQYFEFFYIQRGNCVVSSQKGVCDVEEGQIVLTAPNAYHRIFNASENIERIEFAFSFHPSKAKEQGNTLLCDAINQEGIIILSLDRSVRELLLQIGNSLPEESWSFFMRERNRAMVNLFLVNLFETLNMGKNLSKFEEENAPWQDEKTMDEFFALNFMSNSSNKELADKLHVTPRHLHRIIKKKYNKNYREKIKEVRVEVAKDLLLTTDKSIHEIAELMGYGSSANFSTFMKNNTGKTPSQIRKER